MGRNRFPFPRFAGSPAYWLTTKTAPGQVRAHFPGARGWRAWIDARNVGADSFASDFTSGVPGDSVYNADGAHSWAWAAPAPELVPVSAAALRRALAFLLPIYAGAQPSAYQRVHVGPDGALGMTDGKRAHVFPPPAPGLPSWTSAHLGALDMTTRAARAAGASVVGIGADESGALVTRAVGPALDVVTRTEPEPPLAALWNVFADETAAAAGLCAVLAVDTPEQAAGVRAAIATAPTEPSGRVYVRADTEGVWTCGADFGDWRTYGRWSGRYWLEADRNEEKATTVCLPLAQMAAALDMPPPFRLSFRDDWSPVRVESEAGHRALVMPWRVGALSGPT